MENKLENNSHKYYQGIDLLRFIGATCVIIHHCFQCLGERGLPNSAASYHMYSGKFFLDTFFIISGFLIATIIYKEINSGIFSFKKFMARRIIRIWPMYFFVVILLVVILPLRRGLDESEVMTNFTYAATFTTNFQIIFGDVFKSTYKVLWSVCVEEHLYIVFPLLVFVFGKLKYLMTGLMILVGIISVYSSPEIFQSNSGFNINHFISSTYLFHFGIGALMAILIMNFREYIPKISKVVGNTWVQIIVLIIGMGFVFTLFTDVPYSETAVLLLAGILGTWLVFVAATGKLLFDVFGTKTTQLLGNISYPMYLIHPILVWGFCFKNVIKNNENLSESDMTIVYPLVSIIVTMLVATLLHFLIEAPFKKMRKKLSVLKAE